MKTGHDRWGREVKVRDIKNQMEFYLQFHKMNLHFQAKSIGTLK